MSRVQLALNVADLEAAIGFYSRLFGVQPAKVHPGYANFAIVDPPLKLVLIETQTQEAGSLNHLGIEVATSEEVAAAQSRVAGVGLITGTEDRVLCCHAVQDKVWVENPAGSPWEIYAVLADTDLPTRCSNPVASDDSACCTSQPNSVVAGCC